MFTMTVTYKDFKDVEHTEVAEFNLSDGEVVELDNTMREDFKDGFKTMSELIASGTMTPTETYIAFQRIIFASYGKTSEDGLYFEKKTAAEATNFKNSALFQAIFRKLLTEPGIVDEFISGILPKEDPYTTMLKASSRPKKAPAKRK